ncbi:unnamed protein product [Haemonchus placei]|uniref:Uncharacterized protein n=1 Tax=Haemonchus placei TaxID=6290 RepID=A0A3P7XKE3_HAEPC|nr:unnamed protein product [Haemonchus placei]
MRSLHYKRVPCIHHHFRTILVLVQTDLTEIHLHQVLTHSIELYTLIASLTSSSNMCSDGCEVFMATTFQARPYGIISQLVGRDPRTILNNVSSSCND